MKILLTTLMAFALFFVGCGSKEGVRSEAQKSYLYFTGNVDDVSVSIDKAAAFEVKAGENNQYTTKPGKHLIEVYRDGVLIIKREIYLGDGVAKEIEVR
jgi:hypothetical protein